MAVLPDGHGIYVFRFFFHCYTCVYISCLACELLQGFVLSNGAYFHFLTQSPKYSDEQKKLIFLGSRSACLGYFRIYLTVDF